MQIYVPLCGKNKLQPFLDIGVNILYTPYDSKPKHQKYAIDNGAFKCWKHGLDFDELRFYSYINNLAIPPQWVVIPDLVAQGNKSLDFSAQHYHRIPYPKYVAIQDGMTEDAVRSFLDHYPCAGLFIGGTLKWKRNNAKRWCDFAHGLNLKCHVGRVGTQRWYWIMFHHGVDSVDGSSPVRNQCIHDIIYFHNQVREQVKLCSFPAL
jgi:hypothetical protein